LVQQVSLEHLDQWDPQVLQDNQDLLAQLVSLVHLDLLAYLVHRVVVVDLDLVDLLELQEHLVILVVLDL
jgi:hypothetical protein